MQVTPRVSPDGAIVMQIYTEKSTVGPDATGIPIAVDANGNPIRSPQIPITTAQTIVLARSGQTVILGGLITKDLEEDTRRVPYLADIPVIGRLFRYDQVHNKRTELLIILTPFLVTSTDQIDWINAREGQRMSWCLADLVNIHGPVPFPGNPMFNPSPTPLIYPDIDPAGYPTGPDPYGPVPSFPPPGGGPPPAGVPGMTVPGSIPTPSTTPTPVPPAPAAPAPYPPGAPPYGTPPPSAPPYGAPPYGAPPTSIPPYGLPPPIVPPAPPAPGLGAPENVPQRSIVVPPPPSPIPPGPPGGGHGALAPPAIEAVAPPAGTARLPRSSAPQMPFAAPPNTMYPLTGPQSVAPADYQQPVMR